MPMPSSRTSPCPFCGVHFVRVANHLRSCKLRGGRDYTTYLTRSTSPAGPGRGVCVKCGRRFRRGLDAHLRVSASCRDVASRGPAVDSTPAQSDSASLRPPTLPMNTIPQTTETAATCPPLPALLHTFKRPLRLPKSTEEWAEANYLLSAISPTGHYS